MLTHHNHKLRVDPNIGGNLEIASLTIRKHLYIHTYLHIIDEQSFVNIFLFIEPAVKKPNEISLAITNHLYIHTYLLIIDVKSFVNIYIKIH